MNDKEINYRALPTGNDEVLNRVIQWLWSGELSIPNKAILARTFGLKYYFFDSSPYSKRERISCIKLLAEIPECCEGLDSLAAEYPEWREARALITCDLWVGIWKER